MGEKMKHSNDEIFDLLSAMAVDIEEIKKDLFKEHPQSSSEINPMKELEKEVLCLKSLKRWLKFLFYECPKYSFSKQNRRKFLTDLGRIIQLLISVIIIALLFLLANDNYHLREKVTNFYALNKYINLNY